MKELNEAKVLAVGPGMMDKDGKRIPMGVSQGDKVLIPQVRGRDVGDALRWAILTVRSLAEARSRLAMRSTRYSGTMSKLTSLHFPRT